MQTSPYALALEQAENERAEICAQIEQLQARDAKLEKLAATLKEILPNEEAAAQPAAEEASAPEQTDSAPENQGS